MRFCLLIFLPMAAAVAAYPLARKNARAGNVFVIAVTALVLALALSVLVWPAEALTLPGLCGTGLRQPAQYTCRGRGRDVDVYGSGLTGVF